MTPHPLHRPAALAAALLLAAALGAAPARAVDTPDPTPPPAPTSDDKKDTKGQDKKDTKTDDKKAGDKRSQFLDGYRQAHALIYRHGDYAAGIAALRALGHDEHADVANLIGFASRKLGRYDDARHWYEKALAADPKHARTWSYYGMWHAEQGNRLKAQDFLDKVRLICGNTECREYRELEGVIDGTRSY